MHSPISSIKRRLNKYLTTFPSMLGIKLSRVVIFLMSPSIWVTNKLPMERERRMAKIMMIVIKYGISSSTHTAFIYLQSWYESTQRVAQVKRSPSCIQKQILWRRIERGWSTCYCAAQHSYQPKGSDDPSSIYTFGTTCNGGPEEALLHRISRRTPSLSTKRFQ